MKLAYDLYSPSGDKERNLPPVIMMHGMLDSRKTWKNIAPQIAHHTGRKVYTLDARNHGESPWSDNFTFGVNAEDLDYFLWEHEIQKAALVGHSMGGRTAITLALKKPEKVEKIVVEDMIIRSFKPNSAGLIVEIIHMMKESLNYIPTGTDEATAKQSIFDFIGSLFKKPKNDSVKKKKYDYDLSMVPLKWDGTKYSWEANLDVIENMLTTEKITHELSNEMPYTGDALFLNGTNSFFNVDKDPLILKLFPRATLLKIEGATHLVHTEFPKRFIEEVSSFLNNGIELKAKY